MKTVVRCDDLFRDALEHFTQAKQVRNTKPIQLFVAGFVTGLCEKVYLGASDAAMIKPPYKDGEWILGVVGKIAVLYGLDIRSFREDDRIEIWFLRNKAAGHKLAKARQSWRSAAERNKLRGELCGVPRKEINPSYPIKFRTLKEMFGTSSD